ncbi:MAG TPA: signal peptidase I [Ruminococcaceae bacterium]|jgi:signal peptidase I|nr:signal peptidase I [Oscillospiraceae bacterium]
MADPENSDEMLPKKHSGFTEGCYEWVEALMTALIAVMILFVFFFRLNVEVQGKSMEPNYYEGYRLFVSCTDRSFKSGDVVVIDAAGTKLNDRLIKRIIATEGQTVNINFSSGYVYIDGKPLDESAYIKNGITKQKGTTKFPLTVPKGHVFVLGDNRPVSEDSRFTDVGVIDTHYIMGKVSFLLSPFHGFHSR